MEPMTQQALHHCPGGKTFLSQQPGPETDENVRESVSQFPDDQNQV